MYFQLTRAMKRRFIMELRRFWSYHPKYRDDLVDNIQGKYKFAERPQIGIVVKGGSGSPVHLSPDNFLGTIHSYVTLAHVRDQPGQSIEWVRENAIAVRENNGFFPSDPGVYYIEVTTHDPVTGEGEFFVDPLLDVRDERPTMVSTTEGVLEKVPLANTLRLYETPGNLPLQEGEDYSFDPGDPLRFILVTPLEAGQAISADYRYPAPSTGPWKFMEERAVHNAVPGVVLAFGRRVELGDQQAIVVYDRRQPSALAYGGKWSVPYEFDILARDHETQMEVADQSVMYMFGVLRSHLSKEGIEITEVSLDGESEEVYDEAAQDYYYNSSFSIQVETDWEIHYPLEHSIRAGFGNFVDNLGSNIARTGPDPTAGVDNLDHFRDPFFARRNASWEIIR